MKSYLCIYQFYLSLHNDFPRIPLDSYILEFHYFQYRYLYLRMGNQHKDLKYNTSMIIYNKFVTRWFYVQSSVISNLILSISCYFYNIPNFSVDYSISLISILLFLPGSSIQKTFLESHYQSVFWCNTKFCLLHLHRVRIYQKWKKNNWF